MRDTITDSNIAFYHRNGFFVLENMLAPAELEQWRTAIDNAVANRLKNDKRTFEEKSKREQVFLQIMNLWTDNPAVKELMFDERLGRMAARLAGVDGVRIFHDQALIKEPNGRATLWHQDLPYWSFTHRAAISIWVALDDATEENGCLRYIPGSHNTEVLRSVNLGADEDEPGLLKRVPQLHHTRPVSVPVKAGSAIFHNGLTFHAAGKNTTSRHRRAMTCAYMPDGSTYNGSHHGVALRDAKFEVGEVLDRSDLLPLIYSERTVVV